MSKEARGHYGAWQWVAEVTFGAETYLVGIPTLNNRVVGLFLPWSSLISSESHWTPQLSDVFKMRKSWD